MFTGIVEAMGTVVTVETDGTNQYILDQQLTEQ